MDDPTCCATLGLVEVVADGATNDAEAINDRAASLTNGGTLLLPPGRIAVDILNIPSNVTLQGSGLGTTLVSLNTTFDENDDQPNGLINVDNASNVRIERLTIDTNSNRPTIKLIGSTNVTVSAVTLDGEVLSTGNLTGYGIHVAGSNEVLIENCRIQNCANGVWVSRSGGATGPDSGSVTVDRCQFWQTNHGTDRHFPTGVYGYYVDELTVSNCRFLNIKPSTNTNPLDTGYGVYEGDGTCSSLSIRGCVFRDDDGITTLPTRAILASRAKRFSVDDCEILGPFVDGIYGRGIHQSITNVRIFNPKTNGIVLAGFLSTLPDSAMVEGCTIIGAGETGIKFGDVNGVAIGTAAAIGNLVKRCGRAGIWASSASYASIIGNTVVDCNSTSQATRDADVGITFYGARDGLVDGNTIINTAAASVTASITGTVMTVTAIAAGAVKLGGAVSGSGVSSGTSIVAQLSGTSGGIGTYSVSASQTVASTTITIAGGLMNYGIGCSTATNRMVVTPNNVIIGMVVAPTVNLLATAPSTGTWSAGQQIHFWSPVNAGLLGVECIASGSPGTWVDMPRIGSPVTSSAASLGSITAQINTTGKYTGKLVIDTTNNRMVYAAGSSAGAVWWQVDGQASIPPM